MDKRRYENVLDIRSFRGTDCDADLYPVMAKLRREFQ
jgi:hypothetical protein